MSLESDIKHILDTDAEFDEPLAFEYNGSHELADEVLVRLGSARQEIKRLREVIKGGETALARELCAQQLEAFAARLVDFPDTAHMVRAWAAEVRSGVDAMPCLS